MDPANPPGADLRRYEIRVAPETLADLDRRLEATRWSAAEDGGLWDDGAPVAYLQDLVRYWRTGFDWPAREAHLNGFPQFLIEIDGEPIHFVWMRSAIPDAMPVLITHGWPGSFVEYLAVGEELCTAGYDVVIPTLPGFGLPGPPRTGHWTVAEVVAAWARLMQQLGYERYVAHGVDIGAIVTRVLGTLDADRVAAIHVTIPVGGTPDVTGRDEATLASAAERAAYRYAHLLGAYAFLHATRPQSIGHALADSPAALLGWLIERYQDWTGAQAGPHEVIDRDDMLTTAMLYWTTNAAATSARFYKTNRLYGRPSGPPPVATTPTAVSVFGDDIVIPERELAARYNTITRWVEHPTGGHFPGFEMPRVLVRDLLDAFEPFRA